MIRMQLNFEHVEEWYVLCSVVKKSKDEKQIKMHIKHSVVLLYFIIVLFFLDFIANSCSHFQVFFMNLCWQI